MENTIRLKKVLIGNAIFSMVSGTALILLAKPLKTIFEIESSLVFYFIGPGLILFGLDVYRTAQKKLDKRKQILTISILDFGWVAASLIIILTGAFNLSWMAYEVIGFVATVVLLFGVLQLKFNR